MLDIIEFGTFIQMAAFLEAVFQVPIYNVFWMKESLSAVIWCCCLRVESLQQSCVHVFKQEHVSYTRAVHCV